MSDVNLQETKQICLQLCHTVPDSHSPGIGRTLGNTYPRLVFERAAVARNGKERLEGLLVEVSIRILG